MQRRNLRVQFWKLRFHSCRPWRSCKKLTYVTDHMLSWIVLVDGVFRPSKRDGFGSQFILKSMFTWKELVSKKLTDCFLQTLSHYWIELVTYSWLLLALNSRGASSVVMLYLRKKWVKNIHNNSLLIDQVKPSVSIFSHPLFMVKIRPPSHATF